MSVWFVDWISTPLIYILSLRIGGSTIKMPTTIMYLAGLTCGYSINSIIYNIIHIFISVFLVVTIGRPIRITICTLFIISRLRLRTFVQTYVSRNLVISVSSYLGDCLYGVACSSVSSVDFDCNTFISTSTTIILLKTDMSSLASMG